MWKVCRFSSRELIRAIQEPMTLTTDPSDDGRVGQFAKTPCQIHPTRLRRVWSNFRTSQSLITSARSSFLSYSSGVSFRAWNLLAPQVIIFASKTAIAGVVIRTEGAFWICATNS